MSKNQQHSSSDTNKQSSNKVIPHAPEIENAVLGAMLLTNTAFNEVMPMFETIGSDAKYLFFNETNQLVFTAMYELNKNSVGIDIATVVHKLRQLGTFEFVTTPYLMGLMRNVASGANISYHAHILVEKYIKREVIQIADVLKKDGFDEGKDALLLLQNAEDMLTDIRKVLAGKQIRKTKDIVKENLIALKEQIESGKTLSGISSGFRGIDYCIGGFAGGDVIFIGARPSMGKTAFMLAIAKNVARTTKAAAYELEMTGKMLVNRVVSSEVQIRNKSGFYQKVSGNELRRGIYHLENGTEVKMTMDNYYEIEREANKNFGDDFELYIDDEVAVSIGALASKIALAVSKIGIKIVFVDYLGLLEADGKYGNENEKISYISRQLKKIAKKLNIPIIVLAQLSRDVEKRGGDKRPQLSDLRASGSIEQDADVVMFLYRPSYYGITEDAQGVPTDHLLEVIVAKNRNGALANIPIFYEESTNYMNDWEDEKGQKRGSDAPLPEEPPTQYRALEKGTEPF